MGVFKRVPSRAEKEKGMSIRRKLGVWIDHTKAVIVTVSEKGEDLQSIQSDFEMQPGYSGSSHPNAPYGNQESAPEDTREGRFANHLNRFYDRVINALRTGGPYLLFGPGEAKVELATRLESGAVRGRIIGVETADKMSDRQIITKVRRYYDK
jgi:hypothetical protein